MDTANLIVGAVLFAVVLIIIISNTQKIEDLRKKVKNTGSASVSPTVATNTMLVRDSNGNFVPKRLFYLRLVPTDGDIWIQDLRPPEIPSDSAANDRVIFRAGQRADKDGKTLAEEVQGGRAITVFRPERRVLFRIDSAFFLRDGDQVWTPIGGSTDMAFSDGYLLLFLRSNSGSGNSSLFSAEEVVAEAGNTVDGTTGASAGDMSVGGGATESVAGSAIVRRTLVVVPAAMSGNSTSGV